MIYPINEIGNYHSYYLTKQYYNEDCAILKVISEKFKFSFPNSISMQLFTDNIIYPIRDFFKLTNSIHLLKTVKRVILKMWLNEDYTNEFGQYCNGNILSKHKTHEINFRLKNKNILTLFHELFHLIDAIQDKYIVLLENKLFGYFHRPHERIANSLSIALYDKLIRNYKEEISLKTLRFINNTIDNNIKTNMYLTIDLMDNYQLSKVLLKLAINRLYKANRILTNNELTL